MPISVGVLNGRNFFFAMAKMSLERSLGQLSSNTHTKGAKAL
jgi:hypothetical protein